MEVPEQTRTGAADAAAAPLRGSVRLHGATRTDPEAPGLA